MYRGNNSDGSDDNNNTSTSNQNSREVVTEAVILDQDVPVWYNTPSMANNNRQNTSNSSDALTPQGYSRSTSLSDRQARRRQRSLLRRIPMNSTASNESTVMSIITHLSNSEGNSYRSSSAARNRYLSALFAQGTSDGQPVTLRFNTRQQQAPTTSSSSPNSFAHYHSGSAKNLTMQCQDCPPILEGLVVCVGSFDDKAKQELLMNCEALGARVRSRYTPDCTHLITLFQMGDDYERACADSKVVASSQWLEDCITARRYLHPSHRVIHYPLRQPNGIPSMKSLVISVTGFVGEERSELKYLIRASGAKYSGALSKKDNTHLICSIPEGEKYTKALEWGVTVVNRRWLDDCVKEWRRADEALYKDIGVNR